PPAYATALGVKTTPDGVPLATYGQRVGAYLLDMLMVGILTTVAGWYWISRLVTWYTAWLSDLMDQAQSGVQPTINQADLTNEIYGHVLALSLAGMTVTALAASLQMSRTAAYRLLGTLESRGYVGRLPDARVRLGYAVTRLAAAVAPLVRAAATPVLRRLADEVGATAHLTLVDGDAAL